MLSKTFELIERKLSPLSHFIGNIGAGLIGAMMLLTVADIVGRLTFNQPVYGALEVSEYMLVVVVFFSAAHCEFTRGHVTIGLFIDRLGPRAQNIVDSIVYFLFLLTFCWLTYHMAQYGAEVFGHNVVSGSLKIPKFPIIYLAAFGSGLLSIFVFIHFMLFLAGAIKK